MCTSNETLQNCSIISPENSTYSIDKKEENVAYFNDSQICLHIKERKCVVRFSTLRKNYQELWKCFTQLKDIFEQDSDALIYRRAKIFEKMLPFDSFDISSELLQENDGTRYFDVVYARSLITILCFVTIVVIVLRLSTYSQLFLQKMNKPI